MNLNSGILRSFTCSAEKTAGKRESLLFAVACAADPDIKAHLVRLKGKLEMMNDSDWRFLFFHVRVYVDKWMKASQELFFTLKEQVFEEGLLVGHDYAVGGDEK